MNNTPRDEYVEGLRIAMATEVTAFDELVWSSFDENPRRAISDTLKKYENSHFFRELGHEAIELMKRRAKEKQNLARQKTKTFPNYSISHPN